MSHNLIEYAFAVVALIVLIALSAIFVGSEFSLTTLESSSLPKDIDPKTMKHARGFQLVARAHNNLIYTLSTVQLGITIATILSGIVSPLVFGPPVSYILHACGLHQNWVNSAANVIATILVTSLSMVVGELVPKGYALAKPLPTAVQTVWLTWGFSRIFAIPVKFFDLLARKIVQLCGVTVQENVSQARSAEELRALFSHLVVPDWVNDNFMELVDRSLQFGKRTAEECMTPRSRVITVQATDPLLLVLSVASKTGHSRFPIVRGDFDDCIGVIDVRDILALSTHERTDKVVSQLSKPIATVPDSLAGDEVMAVLRSSQSRIVLVADEYGGNAGIITLEDLIEEIVGEVNDEYDPTLLRFEPVGSGYRLVGMLRLDEIEQELDIFPPEGPYETMGGLIMALSGNIPTASSSVIFTDRLVGAQNQHSRVKKWKATVEKMDGFSVSQILLEPYLAHKGGGL